MKTDDMKYDIDTILYTPQGKEHFAIEQYDQILTWEGNVYDKDEVMSDEELMDALNKFRLE